ncbi:galactose mutarotase [Polymorphobacter arshaanensis]|uniref:Aldose 1-epimerase n=1 Tax=Glacieibacterium arshaanense TaxID=2511025 RepID=A0A4Y9EQS9_9SPHN|nr:aldose epimerase family protein [Polymorphobacter arshaanensis]TFU05966.1 galactose mutarotase [Polymorphobacter arshaanensis]
MPVNVSVSDFGTLPDGSMVQAVTLSAGAVRATILTLGGILQSLQMPGRDGCCAEVTLGHDDVAGYLTSRSYPGAIIGRTAGRIAGGRVSVDGVTHQLSQNEGDNTLHGGAQGFDRALWRLVAAMVEDGAAVLRLSHQSTAGDQGYPGALTVVATYRLDAAGLTLALAATSDAPTPVNLTWHPYWNLSGAGTPVGDHVLQLDASAYYPSGAGQVTAGAAPVAGTVFDFRVPQQLGDILASADPQAVAAGGIDHVFVRGSGTAAVLSHPASGRRLTVTSPAPALVVYSGVGLAGGPPGHGGQVIGRHGGIAFEPQALPDALPVLRPGATFDWQMTLGFDTD